ncbi:MAG TPA: hypothetical protein EYQ26_01260 [Rhodospirillales bacterium]|nr:hypothetical protein [Rhodospirillales bacterium]
MAPRPEFQLRHRWEVGTLAVWGNTATQHATVDVFFSVSISHPCNLWRPWWVPVTSKSIGIQKYIPSRS